MVPSKPRDFNNPKCLHINGHSVLNGPWVLCDDCGVQHVRAVVAHSAAGVHIEAGARSIQRALAEAAEVPVGASDLTGSLVITRDGYGALTATLAGLPVRLTGL